MSNQANYRRPWRNGAILAGVSILTVLGIHGTGWAQRNQQIRIDRHLSVESMSGEVSVLRRNVAQTAAVGDRLQAVGDGLTTGRQSVAKLAIDTQIGFLDVAESTRMLIRRMAIAPDSGRITHIEVPQGQVNLRVRPFTHEGSELEIYTPAGVSSVRGTEFGLTVQPDGKMGVATLEGSVATSAQGETIEVPEGFQNLTVPGEPPTPAVPLQDDPDLTTEIVRIIDGGNRRLQLVGQTDPVNLVFIEDEPQTINVDGQFTLDFLPIRSTSTQITVITPLGTRRDYDVAVF